MVEKHNVIVGKFNAMYLKIPDEILTITIRIKVPAIVFEITDALSNFLLVLRKYHIPIVIDARNGIIKNLCLPKSISTTVFSSTPSIAICSSVVFTDIIESTEKSLMNK